ncbi:uncharacterized protein LOC134650800 [Cydia amplana]|uniref:uncharacterized protein LOC134650800 n=1 Tax=Cydia amplana TaxID=1869771 RepID=UPI002FE622B6
MEVNELFTKLKELGYTNTKRAELRELCNQKNDQILKYLPRRILNSDGSKIIDCLFNGFSDNTPSYRSKLKVIDIVIKTLRKESTSLTHCGDLISRIGLELAKAPASELVQWSNDTVQSIVDDSDVNMIWRDILPECLNTLSASDTVKHCGTDMTVAEYREQCIRTLCQCGWKERQLVQLTAMFNDMQLPRNEHKQVVNKICTYIMDCPPDTLPALVHQLIKLCKTQDFDIVLSHLGYYFSAQLYSKLAPPTPDSEATTMDIDDIVPHSPAEVSRCLSTCIYHIVEVMEKPQLCKVLRGWPRSQLLRAPFLLDLALALCGESDCRALCLDVIPHSPAEVSRCLSTCIYHIVEVMEKPQLCKVLRGWPRSQLLRAPFLLDLALALCGESDCRALCLDVIPHSPAEVSRCLSTCIYHIVEVMEKPQLCKVLRGWPRSQLLRAPFLLDLALALCGESDCRALCLDVIPHSPAEVSRCLSTCIYHIVEVMEKPQLCKVLRGWPRSQLLRAPFLLDLALALCGESDCRALCLDVIPHSPAEVSRCLSTCIYHIVEVMEKPQLCKVLRGWPRSQLLRAPFLLDLALALCGESDCRALCLDVIPHSPAEVSRCLSTCIYHIVEVMEKPQLCKVLRGWPRSQLLRAPFLLDLALALCGESDCRALCLDVMKAGILSRETECVVRSSCAGARAVLPRAAGAAAVLPRAAGAAAVLRALTTESASHRQLTVLGLISLAFSLLSTPRGKPHAGSCWSLGKLILARLSKAQPETAPHILATLADRLNTASPQRQYADCLFVLCKLTPISVERCSQLSAILENCRPSADLRSCALVLEAVHPLINFSARTRDCLFMVCRKGINSRDSAHRRLALSGFLTVLRHVKVSGTFSSSQSTYSEDSHASYLTQLTIVHSTQAGAPAASSVRNEAVCLEVVSILRRCLVQDAAVKQLLYTRLYECVKDKPGLHECVLEFLNEHLAIYLEEDQVLWDKCVLINGPTAVLVEPISHLLYVTAQFLQEEDEELEDILASQADNGSAVLRSKLALDLAKICDSERFGHIEVDDVGLSDLTPESKAKSFKVQQMLSSYEALVGYQVMKWDRESPRTATVLSLFKGYTQLLENTKATPKLGKKGSKSTLNETRETVKSQKSQKTQDKENRPVKVSSLTKDRGAPFKTLPCVWDLKVCLRVMELLYSEEVPWCTLEQRNRIRSSREFHHWSLRCVRSVVELSDKQGVKLITNIATIMYKRCVCRFRDMCEFDDTTALGCVELFTDCLTFILSPDHGFKTDGFLSAITEISDEQESTYMAAILEHVHTALCQVEEESAEEGDSVNKKLVAACCQLADVLLEAPVVACERYTAALLKLEDYVRTSKQDCLSLIPPLLTAGARIQQEAPLLDQLLDKLASALGRIDVSDRQTGLPVSHSTATDGRGENTAGGAVAGRAAGYRQDCLSLIPPLLTAGARIQQEAPLLDELLDKLASALCRIDEEDTSAGGEDTPNFPSVDCRTGHAVLTHVCVHLSQRGSSAEHLLQLARDLDAALPTAARGQAQAMERATGHAVLTHVCVHLNQRGSSAEHLLQLARDLDAALPTAARGQAQAMERELQEVYSAVILQLCQLSSWSRAACTLRCTVGVGSARVLSSLARLYTLLATLVRQLSPVTLDSNIRSVERLLKLCGKKLSSAVDNLVIFLEAASNKARDTKQIPRVVFEAERFGRQVALLSANTKDNLVIFLEAASNKARDTKQIPRVVFEAERFGRQVALLSANTKVNLMQYLPMGTARDFRIRAPVIEEMLKDNPEIDEAEDEDAPAEAPSPVASDNGDSRGAGPPSKRRRS